MAADLGKIDIVNLLILFKAKIDVKDITLTTRLLLATLRGQVPVVKILLEYGANYNLTTVNGNNALALANQALNNKFFTFNAVSNYIYLLGLMLNGLPHIILDQTTLALPLGHLITQYAYGFCESEENNKDSEKL